MLLFNKPPFFTSDHHFGHKEAIAVFKRPFPGLDDMHTALINYWNEVVQPSDVVYHLGDFGFGYGFLFRFKLKRMFRALNGYKILVIGNHDLDVTLDLPWTDKMKEETTRIQGQTIHMSHHVVRKKYHKEGVKYFHGHAHGRSAPGLDVGVDCWNYHPISFDQAMREYPVEP